MEPAKYCFIITNDASWKIDWNRFDVPDPMKLVLIADKKSIELIKEKKQDSLFLHMESYHASLKALIEIVKRLKERFVGPKDRLELISINEDDLMFCAQLREHFNLPGDRVKDIERFTNKITMKNALSNLSSCVPRHLIFDRNEYKNAKNNYVQSVVKYLGLPVFIKPISASSSTSISKIISESELARWCLEHQSDETLFEIDEYIDAVAYHCDSIVIEGQIVESFVSRYLFPPGKWVIEKPIGGSIFLPNHDPVSIKIKEFNKQVLKALDTKESYCSHHELFIRKNGEIVFLEIAKRAPGCFIPDMYIEQIGLDLREIDYKLRLGLPVSTDPKFSKNYHAWIFFMEREGYLDSFHSLDFVKSEIVNFKKFKNVGDALCAAKDLSGVVAQLLLRNADFHSLSKDFAELGKCSPYFLRRKNSIDDEDSKVA